MAYVNRAVRAVVPDILDIVVTPFLTLIISAFIALSVIGPFGRLVGDGVSFGLQYAYHTGGAVAGVLFGGVYSAIVVTGIHHSFHAIEAGLLSNPSIGVNFLLPIWSMANVAQGGACLAAFFWCKDEKIRQIALPASVSCLLGITEAALFGVNLRLFRPFLAAAVGGALGGGYVAFNHVAMTAVGVTGLPGMTIVAPGSIIHYIIGMAIAFSVAFVCSFLFGQGNKTAD
jgi:PTS system sucrose-specific IIC component